MSYLDRLCIRARSGRPQAKTGTIATVSGKGERFVQFCFQSRGCRYSDMGGCLMCDYGCGHNLKPVEIRRYLEDTTVLKRPGIQELLVGTYGSIFDEYEMPEECLEEILKCLGLTEIPQIGFETHCDTVTTARLELIKRYLPDRQIYVEMGFESVDDTVRKHYLNKKLELNQLEHAIRKVHENGFEVVLNILLGSPCLDRARQIQDVCDSVDWAFGHGSDYIVLFPVNVKPFTVLYQMMEKGLYEPISKWTLVYALQSLADKLDDERLGKINLSWYGEREDIYPLPFARMIPPMSCGKCRESVTSFFVKYQTSEGSERRSLIKEVLSVQMECDCREREEERIYGQGLV